MTWSLRNQMLLPLVIFVAMLGLLISFEQAALQVKEHGDRAIKTYIDVSNELSHADPAKVAPILASWQSTLPGWEFVVVRQGAVELSTIPLRGRQQAIVASMPPAPHAESGRDAVLLATAGDWYYVIAIEVPGWPQRSYLVCLEPYQSIASTVTGAFRRSGTFAFFVALMLILVAAIYSGRLSGRVTRIQQRVRRIAEGDLSKMADDRGHDEISELAKSVNVMVTDLASMKRIVRDTERARLHAQLAGGLAHELRNGIHAARLSIEMFRETTESIELPSTRMLANAQEQLTITESLVRRLLALGKPQHGDTVPRELRDVLLDVVGTVETVSRHAEVDFVTDIDDAIACVATDSESMQAAILNLCLNAVEAAGRHGDVRLSARALGEEAQIQVSDSGPGPDEAIAESLFEPFMTTKPEGVGLGLVLVRQAVTQEGGTVDWIRDKGRTVFRVTLPTRPEPPTLDAPSTPATEHPLIQE
ncbi:Globin-coupled histidine kinase [Planctomycetes bacterium Pan216]|uniref:histidine kinase n=1 Tax=Kolteria novifilia TaxID=2527975 RepID=A0A518B4R2_9BACT|nr:Globin-coupled histidine kinase [Planctomycetes bacterium Pan216]